MNNYIKIHIVFICIGNIFQEIYISIHLKYKFQIQSHFFSSTIANVWDQTNERILRFSFNLICKAIYCLKIKNIKEKGSLRISVLPSEMGSKVTKKCWVWCMHFWRCLLKFAFLKLNYLRNTIDEESLCQEERSVLMPKKKKKVRTTIIHWPNGENVRWSFKLKEWTNQFNKLRVFLDMDCWMLLHYQALNIQSVNKFNYDLLLNANTDHRTWVIFVDLKNFMRAANKLFSLYLIDEILGQDIELFIILDIMNKIIQGACIVWCTYLVIAEGARLKTSGAVVKIIFPSPYETFIKTKLKNFAEIKNC